MEDKKPKANLIMGVMVLALIGGAFYIGRLTQKVETLSNGTTNTQATTQQQAQAAPAPTKVSIDAIKGLFEKQAIKFGDANKKLLFVEVGDPSCPYCHVAGGKNPELNTQVGANFKLVADGGTYLAPVPEMKKLVDSGKASFVYIYTPGHGSGEMAMKAMYCANEKGKFWQAHDLFMSKEGYELQNTVVKNDTAQSGKIADFIKSVVDASFIKSCLDSGKYDKTLQDDVAAASALGVSGTPGFFVNDSLFSGAYSFNDMKSAVDTALN